VPLGSGAKRDREWILGRLPHQGGMCLLDEVLDWDPRRVRCRAANHRAADHPLRAHGRLGVACGIEYAAQAMAVHGALLGDTAVGDTAGGAAARTGTGLLAGLRGVRFQVARLDDVPGDLICEAARVAVDGGMVLYEFAVHGAAVLLLTGRASVVFGRAGPP
jgi:predicted hotdog family 3-hydroxylacyl-ACP dehydratase